MKEVKGRNIKNQTAAASKCQRANQLWGAEISLSQYYSRLALTWWLRGNRISRPCDVGTLCSAASSLCPSSVPAFLCLSSISFQMSTSLIRLTWENCCLAAALRLSDRSSTRLFSFFLLPSHLWSQHTWSATHHERHQLHPLQPPPLKPSWGAAEGSGMSLRWHDSHSHAAQRDKFEMFKGDCIVCVSKHSVQI